MGRAFVDMYWPERTSLLMDVIQSGTLGTVEFRSSVVNAKNFIPTNLCAAGPFRVQIILQPGSLV
jgi:hypothetical protein